MNCPEVWTPPEPPPDLIRPATGLPAGTAIVLYQGQLMSERGIEQTMEAILEVPDAVLVLLGFGDWAQKLRRSRRRRRTPGGSSCCPPCRPPS